MFGARNGDKKRFDAPSEMRRAPRAVYWPRARIDAGLKRAFASILVIGEDDTHTIYDVEDDRLRFVVALVHEEGPKKGVSEIGFLARFAGFRPSEPSLRKLNAALHLSAAFIEEGDLYLLAKVAAKGPFDDRKFGLVLTAWRRDLGVAFEALGATSVKAGGEEPAAAAFDAGEIRARPRAFHGAFFWRNEPRVHCPACAGRGRRGLLARACANCDGAGFIDPTR